MQVLAALGAWLNEIRSARNVESAQLNFFEELSQNGSLCSLPGLLAAAGLQLRLRLRLQRLIALNTERQAQMN
eukprot:COSAG02_NODE_3454_length_6713_cov_1.602359_1_plen_73_part_00